MAQVSKSPGGASRTRSKSRVRIERFSIDRDFVFPYTPPVSSVRRKALQERSMTMEKEMNLRVNLGAWCLLIFAAPLLIGVAWIDEAAAQKVRVAMPAKSMTFLNFYVGDKVGIYQAE